MDGEVLVPGPYTEKKAARKPQGSQDQDGLRLESNAAAGIGERLPEPVLERGKTLGKKKWHFAVNNPPSSSRAGNRDLGENGLKRLRGGKAFWKTG